MLVFCRLISQRPSKINFQESQRPVGQIWVPPQKPNWPEKDRRKHSNSFNSSSRQRQKTASLSLLVPQHKSDSKIYIPKYVSCVLFLEWSWRCICLAIDPVVPLARRLADVNNEAFRAEKLLFWFESVKTLAASVWLFAAAAPQYSPYHSSMICYCHLIRWMIFLHDKVMFFI